MTRRDHGFTLLEIIIAMVVLGFIMAGLAQATRFGISALGVENRVVDRAAEMARVNHLLRLLIEQSAPPMSADDKPFTGEDHRLEFITRLPASPQTYPVRRSQVAIGVDSDHRLLLRWQPKANATLLLPLPDPQQIVLATGIDHIDVTYRQSVGDGGKVRPIWDDSDLPALVSIKIVPQSTTRHWPVMQAATMIDTNGSF
jgi:general secretion pathway protein J